MALSSLPVITQHILLSQCTYWKHLNVSFKMTHARWEYFHLTDLREEKDASARPLCDRSTAQLAIWLSVFIQLKLLAAPGTLEIKTYTFFCFRENFYQAFNYTIAMFLLAASCMIPYKVSLTLTCFGHENVLHSF